MKAVVAIYKTFDDYFSREKPCHNLKFENKKSLICFLESVQPEYFVKIKTADCQIITGNIKIILPLIETLKD